MNKEIKKATRDIDPWDDNFATKLGVAYEESRKKALDNFDANVELGIALMLRFKEKAKSMGLIENNGTDAVTRTYMITIRPDDKRIDFNHFRNVVQDYVNRRMIENIYAISFEQKGTSEDTLGNGFHVHIIAKVTCRSKRELLLNTISTFKNWTASNCIQVDLCKNPEEVKQKYLIDYSSSDEHKIETKKWDSLWRERNNIAPIYESKNIGNNNRALIESNSGTIIVDLS